MNDKTGPIDDEFIRSINAQILRVPFPNDKVAAEMAWRAPFLSESLAIAYRREPEMVRERTAQAIACLVVMMRRVESGKPST
jgi:hypothetical protein